MEKTLEIKGLKTQFFTRRGIVPAVDGVDLEIGKGRIVGVVGESGCGKSVTALSVMRLLQSPGRITDGEILLNGVDLVKMSDAGIRNIRGNKVSIIFQEPMTSLNPVYTVGKQVSEACLLHQKLSKKQAKERVIDIFRQVGVPDAQKRFDAYPHQLSGGLRQRVMIGMALICNPILMIADEPTTALDVTIEAQILYLMKEMQRRTGASIMMITHNLGVVAEICEYVYVMYAGQIMEQADVRDIFKNASHPYTYGLLNSIPGLSQNKERLYTIKGMVPNMLRLPQGCRFCPRCDRAVKACAQARPGLYKVGDNHYSRCFLYGDGDGAGTGAGEGAASDAGAGEGAGK